MGQALTALYERSAITASAAFLLTLAVILLLAPLARKHGWVDRPGGRKTHAVPTPVIGGLAMALGSLPLAVATFDLTPNLVGLMGAGAIIIVTGVIDDLKDLRWYWRIGAQVSAALVMIYVGDVRVEMIGPLFGAERHELGALSVPFTVLATVGLMNALNMVDGVDGLAGALTAATMIMLAAAAVYSGNERLAHGLLLLLGALAAFLAFNMRTPWKPKAVIFMGNAGSEFLGLVIAWCCFRLTQNADHPVTPALAPFLLGPPVIDCLVLTVRRIRDGRSPFSADRNHFHHILQDAGWPVTAAVLLITVISLAMGAGAALALKAHVAPIWLIVAFAALTIGYYLISSRRDRCLAFFRRFGEDLGVIPPAATARQSLQRGGAGGDAGMPSVPRDRY